MTIKKLAIIIIAVIIVTLGSWIIYDQTHLRLTATSPKNDSDTPTTASIRFTFNHDLDITTAQRFTINPYIDGSATVEKNQLVFRPTTSYQFNTHYTATVKAPHSKNNLTGGDSTVTFKATFVPVTNQTQQQQADGISRTDSLEKTNPFAASLPYETSHYTIGYMPGPDGGGFNYTITILAIINGPQDRPRYELELKQYKQEALDYIRSKNVDPATLTINYVPAEATAY